MERASLDYLSLMIRSFAAVLVGAFNSLTGRLMLTWRSEQLNHLDVRELRCQMTKVLVLYKKERSFAV